ncbi:MAG: peptidylprolyl isomerase [Pseudomonadota bacterium]
MTAYAPGKAPENAGLKPLRGFRLQGVLLARAVGELKGPALLRGLFCAALVSTAALEAIRFGIVERPARLVPTVELVDPVVASVGDDVIRVSDAIAQAAFFGDAPEDPSDLESLIASGTVDDAVNQVALARAARTEGIDEALEIRAALALAERQILAEAYLDQVTTDAVTDDAILSRYEDEAAELAEERMMRLSQIVVADEELAHRIAAALPRQSFASVASKRSIDEASAGQGGRMGEIRARDLHPALAEAVTDLPVGGVSAPVETEQGWHIVKVEARRELRPAPLNERRPIIAAELKREAIVDALSNAREQAPMTIRTAEAIAETLADGPQTTIALVKPR